MYTHLDTKNDYNIYPIILDKYQSGDELELRLGYFTGNKFNSRITSYMYKIMISYLNRKKIPLINTVNQHIVMYPQKIKVIDNEKIIQKQIKLIKDDVKSGVRIALSKEIILNDIPSYNPRGYKKRTRMTYSLPNIKIDITVDNQFNKNHYQVEGEFIKKPTLKQFEFYVNYFKEVNLNLQLGQSMVKKLNMYSKKKNYNPDELFRPPMPFNLKPYYMPYLYNYGVSGKPDGTSMYLVFRETEAWYVGKTSFRYKYKYLASKNLQGTILLGELMENDDYLVYDILSWRHNDISRYPLKHRYNFLRYINKKLNIPKFKLLPLFSSDSLTRNIKLAFQYNLTIKNDGLLFRPLELSYINKEQYKWKPPEHNTIDFVTKKVDGSKYSYYLFSQGKKGLVLFEGNIKYPFSGKINVPTPDIKDNSIMEYKYDYMGNTFVPVRERIDKVNANFITIAQDIWMDIHIPFTKNKLLKISRFVINPLDNEIKILKNICRFINIEQDPTVFDNLAQYIGKDVINNLFRKFLEVSSKLGIRTSRIDLLTPYFIKKNENMM